MDRETVKHTTLAIARLRFLFLAAKIWPTPDASGSAIAISNRRKRLSRKLRTLSTKEAIEAIEQTKKTVNAIAADKTDEALAAIEQATGRICP